MTAGLHRYGAGVRVDVLTAERPTWRGLFHMWAFLAAIPAGLLLILFADQPRARVAAAIYAGSLLLAFGTSSAYHRLAKSYRARKIMQRADHSMIYLLIAGTYVPICLVALPLGWGITMVSVVGGMAVVGIALKMLAFDRLRWFGYALYLIMGWTAVIATPVLIDHLTPTAAGPDGRRRGRVHGRRADPAATQARPVAVGVRLPRDLARVHGARRRAATSAPWRCVVHG